MSTARHPRFPLATTLSFLALAACGPTDSAAPQTSEPSAVETQRDWPPGTVAVVNDEVPISLDDVDLASVWIERIEQRAASRQLRRLAFANIALPQALAISLAGDERAAARERAEAQLAQLRAGEVPGPPDADGGLGEVGEGNWQVLGIPLWGTAVDWEPDVWNLIEEPGRFVIARRLARVDRPHPTALIIRIDSFFFPYLDEDVDLEAAMDDNRLTIVDPEWYEIVPERTLYRMGVNRP